MLLLKSIRFQEWVLYGWQEPGSGLGVDSILTGRKWLRLKSIIQHAGLGYINNLEWRMGDNRPLNPYIKGRIVSYIFLYFIPQLDENVVKVASLHSYFLSPFLY